MPITAQQAWDATDPNLTDTEREQGAQAIIAGVAANDAYWASRPELERLKELAKGEQVPPPHGSQEPVPTVSGTSTDHVIDGTSEDETDTKQVGSGEPTEAVVAAAEAPATPVAPPPAANPPEDVSERLRDQLRNAGMTPEA